MIFILQNSPRIGMYVPVGNSSHQGLVTILTLLVTCGGCVYILSAIADSYSTLRSRRGQPSRQLRLPTEHNPSRKWNISIFYMHVSFVHDLISVHSMFSFANSVIFKFVCWHRRNNKHYINKNTLFYKCVEKTRCQGKYQSTDNTKIGKETGTSQKNY